MTDLCVVCHHREAHNVCPDDRKSIREMITALPRRIEALSLQLMPGQAPAGDRVGGGTTHVEAPLPVRLDALSLIGPGADQVTGMLHPLIRRWSTQTQVWVHATVGGTVEHREITVTEWHRELVTGPDGKPVMVPDDDQIGTLPPREWLDMTVRYWRTKLGHRVPPRTVAALDAPAPPRSLLPTLLPTMLRMAGGVRLFSALHALERVGRDYARAAYFGTVGRVAPAQRPLDPLLDEIETRFGQAPRYASYAADVRYLLDHLDEACDRDLGIAGFTAELRALTAELIRVLGEQPDQVWLGRCPAILVEKDDDKQTLKVCGAGLWQDPYTGSYSNGEQVAPGQVVCPRCHTAWGPRRSEITDLARQIRMMWPVDRRRRYTATEIDNLTPPKCRNCDQRVIIEWRDVTATRDKQRWWQPTGSRCANGCDEARRAF